MAKKNDLKNSMSAGLTGGLDSLIQSTAVDWIRLSNPPVSPADILFFKSFFFAIWLLCFC